MRQTLAKAIRRDLRRSIGESTLATLDQQADAVTDTQDALQLHAKAIDELRHSSRILTGQFRALNGALATRTEPLSRSFMGRLRWLVTGK